MKFTFFYFLVLFTHILVYGDWLSFRGSMGNGFVDEKISSEISADSSNSWSVSLPGRGLSSPIIIGSLVFLTSSSGPDQSNLHIMAFNAENGQTVWERIYRATGRTICHNNTCVAASTMVSDGNVVVAQFSSNDVFCLDLDGNLVWLRGLTYDYPNIANGLGMSSSPVISKGVLVAQVENDADSFTFGINLKNGTTLWKKSRPRGANWTSPVVLKKNFNAWIGLQSKEGLSFLKPESGEVVFTYEGGASTIPSSAIASDCTVLIPSNGLTAIREPIPGEKPIQKWSNNKLSPGTGSPAISGDQVFVINRANVLTSASVQDGTINWRLRIKGPISASPIVSKNLLFVFSEEGLGQVVNISDPQRGEVVNEFEIKDTILCTPAVDKGFLFVRSDNFLWKLGS